MHGFFRELHGGHRWAGRDWSRREGHEGQGSRRWLARGSNGEGVKQVQHALNIPADGFFGPQTEQAVKAFQTAQGLPVDGVVGPRTWAKLLPGEKKEEAPKASSSSSSSSSASSASKKEPEKKEAPEKPVLRRGAVGDAVKEVQRALGVGADGVFGPLTERVVKEFQFTNDLQTDGVVGPRTWDALSSQPRSSDATMLALSNMGFNDVEANTRLLTKHNGDVEAVIAELLGA